MKCLYVITELWSPAGTTKFVVEMANALSAKGDRITIAIRDFGFPDQTMPNPEVEVITIKELLGARIKERWDIVHIHGIWNYPLHQVVVWARKYDIPIIFSPHGMLTKKAMRFKWWKKVVPWFVYQRKDCSSACLWHVTTKREEQDVRRCGFTQPCVICPLGVDIPSMGKRSPGKTRRMLFLSRVHKTKGIEDLIAAWQTTHYSNWVLTIAGPCEKKYQQKLSALVKPDVRIEFLGPVYGEDKKRIYNECDAFVLPTYTENFGVVIAEAMAFGLPVITTYGAPWECLREIGAGYWIPIGREPLEMALSKMMALSDEERYRMGQKGRAYVSAKFSWDVLASELRDGYKKVLNRGS